MTALVQLPLCRLAARSLIAAVLAGSLLCGCQQQPAPEPEPIATLPQIEGPADPAVRFADEAEALGVRFTAVNGEEAGNLAILESLGCGVGLIDVDGDADLDLFAVGGGRFADGSCTPVAVDDGLFRNDGNGMFTASSEQAGILRGTFYAHGVEVGDFDSDGFSDLLITGYDGVRLLANMGDGSFREVPADEHGIASDGFSDLFITGYDGLRLLANMGDGSFREVPAEEHGMASDGWHSTAAAADFNHDGHLDLYCVRYVDWSPDNNPPCVVQGHRDVCPPGEFGGVTDRLWISDGAG